MSENKCKDTPETEPSEVSSDGLLSRPRLSVKDKVPPGNPRRDEVSLIDDLQPLEGETQYYFRYLRSRRIELPGGTVPGVVDYVGNGNHLGDITIAEGAGVPEIAHECVHAALHYWPIVAKEATAMSEREFELFFHEAIANSTEKLLEQILLLNGKVKNDD